MIIEGVIFYVKSYDFRECNQNLDIKLIRLYFIEKKLTEIQIILNSSFNVHANN